MFMLSDVIYWNFMSSWNQIGVLQKEWIPMFMIVLSVPINQELLYYPGAWPQ